MGHDPNTLFVSGYPGRDAERRGELDPTVPFLQKPWRMTELLGLVRNLLDREC